MQVRVGQVTAAQVLEKGRQTNQNCLRKEGPLVVSEEIVEGGDEKPCGLFFGGEADKLAVEEDNVVLATVGSAIMQRNKCASFLICHSLVELFAHFFSFEAQLPHDQQDVV